MNKPKLAASPVAYMRLTGDRVTRISLEKVWDSDIPLYTHPVKEQVETIEYTCPNCQTHVGLHVKHPVKELTDEEIHELWLKCWDEIEFAKAILRKAQEK